VAQRGATPVDVSLSHEHPQATQRSEFDREADAMRHEARELVK